MPPSMHIKNPEDLHRAFNQLDKLTQTRYMEASVMAGMMPIQNQAIENAPKVSTNLARSIHSEIAISRQSYCEGVTGTNIIYGPRTEFGFDGVDSLGRSYHQPAKPWIRPAFDTKRRAAVAEMGDSLKYILNQLV